MNIFYLNIAKGQGVDLNIDINIIHRATGISKLESVNQRQKK